MAGWIFHLRAAEMLLAKLPQTPVGSARTHWYMGNLAPDCGIPVGFAEYIPPKDITHFKEDGRYICPATFAKKHLPADDKTSDRFWFCLGYYAHLSTDVFWVRNILNPEKKRYADLLAQDKKAFYTFIKKDWYDLETLWLGERYAVGETFAPLDLLLAQPDFPNRYLDFFPPDAFTLRLNSLRTQYAPETILPQLDRVRREYTVLTPMEEAEQLKRFVEDFTLQDMVL